MNQPAKFQCPICLQPNSWQPHFYLNSHEAPALKKALLDGELFRFECDHCGAIRLIQTPFIYHDPQLALVVVLSGPDARDAMLIESEAQQQLEDEHRLIDDYHLRRVHRLSDLIEKIEVFDHGLNDQLLEIVKLLTDGVFHQDRPQESIQSRILVFPDSSQPQLLYQTDQDQVLVDLVPEFVTFAQKKYQRRLKEAHLGKFIEVDSHWAFQILDPKLAEISEVDDSLDENAKTAD